MNVNIFCSVLVICQNKIYLTEVGLSMTQNMLTVSGAPSATSHLDINICQFVIILECMIILNS